VRNRASIYKEKSEVDQLTRSVFKFIMRIPTYHSVRKSSGQNIMTPMIDVVFLLLIFFVCASSVRLKELLLPTPLAAEVVEAPQNAGGSANQEKAWIKIDLADSGQIQYWMNDREIADLDELQANLRELAELDEPDEKIPVILEAGDEVPMELLLQVYDTCQAAQFQEISFAIDKPE